MKLPRDLSGLALAQLLRKYRYEITRQTGSHLMLSSTFHGDQHLITIPAHRSLKTGVLSAILSEVAAYLKISRTELEEELFKR